MSDEPAVDPAEPPHAAEPAGDAMGEPVAPPERRPLLERIGMAAIAAVAAIGFGGIAVAAWVGGELFLAVMGGIGCLMTAWVGGLTLFRG